MDGSPRPLNKRLCSGTELSPGCSEEDISRLCQSQPEPFAQASSPPTLSVVEERAGGFCFSQPAQMEDLLLSSQLQTNTQTTCSQVSMQAEFTIYLYSLLF